MQQMADGQQACSQGLSARSVRSARSLLLTNQDHTRSNDLRQRRIARLPPACHGFYQCAT